MSRTHIHVGVRECEQRFPYLAGEYWVTVRDDDTWEAMQTVHIVNELLSHRQSIIWVCQWNEVPIFFVFVDDDQYAIEGDRFGQSLDEIHTDDTPGLCWYWQWVQ